MAVDIKDSKVRFIWNAGNGLGTVTNDMIITNEQNFINEEAKWFHVQAER